MTKIFEFAQRLVRIGFRCPADLRHVLGVANATAASMESADAGVRVFPEMNLASIVSSGRFTYQLFADAQASITLLEAGALRVEKPREHEIAAEPLKGELLPKELRAKVTILEADSALYDTTPFKSSMGLVFVDGAHSYEYARDHTAKALELLRPGGCVAWHGCAPNHPEVVAVVKTCGLPVSLVRGTALAFALKP
jgi:hypothetical protein